MEQGAKYQGTKYKVPRGFDLIPLTGVWWMFERRGNVEYYISNIGNFAHPSERVSRPYSDGLMEVSLSYAKK